MTCIWEVSWVGRCTNTPLPGAEFCLNHFKKKCVSCGDIAVKDCGSTLGPLVCGAPLCELCRDDGSGRHDSNKQAIQRAEENFRLRELEAEMFEIRRIVKKHGFKKTLEVMIDMIVPKALRTLEPWEQLLLDNLERTLARYESRYDGEENVPRTR